FGTASAPSRLGTKSQRVRREGLGSLRENLISFSSQTVKRIPYDRGTDMSHSRCRRERTVWSSDHGCTSESNSFTALTYRCCHRGEIPRQSTTQSRIRLERPQSA